ncbi:hypothetical protein KQ310_13295 [Synechococcus sp. CS-1328]|nr:hypothetical protein [Synechococcus sp. CS-1328]
MKPDTSSGKQHRAHGSKHTHASSHPSAQASAQTSEQTSEQTEHPESCRIHQSTISHWCTPVSDPEHPGQQIPLYALEQRQRAASYIQQHR